MAKYYVSGVWKDNNNNITHLNIHLVTDGEKGVQQAKKYTLEKAIDLVEDDNTVYTANWNYADVGWNGGARIHVVPEGNKKYLRSNHDNSKKDNLDNMLPMPNLGLD